MPAPTALKLIVGNIVAVKATTVTNDAAQIYGAQWRSKKIDWSVVHVVTRVPRGCNWKQTFVTVAWKLPNQTKITEVSSWVIKFVQTPHVALPHPRFVNIND